MTNAGWRVGRHHTAVCDKVDDQHKEEVPGCCGFVRFILLCFCQVYWRPLEVTYIPFIFLGLQPILSDHHPTLCSSVFSSTIYTFLSLHSPTISPLLRSPIKQGPCRPLPSSFLFNPAAHESLRQEYNQTFVISESFKWWRKRQRERGQESMISDDGSSSDAANDFHLIAPPPLLESAGDEEKGTRGGQRVRKREGANNDKPFSL